MEALQPNSEGKLNQLMPEVVVTTAGTALGGGFWMGSSAGMAYKKDDKVYPVIFTVPSGHSVIIYEEANEAMKNVMSHIFITRYAKTVLSLEGDFEVFRLHVVGSTEMEDGKYLYGDKIVSFQPQKGIWVFYGFEHIAGPYLVEPYGLVMSILNKSKDIMSLDKPELVPEREEYVKNPPHIPHPGIFNTEDGPAAYFEALITNQALREKKLVIQ